MPKLLPSHTMAKILLQFLVPVVIAGSSRAQQSFGNVNAINPVRLKAHLEFIASDEMEGRDTPSRGLDVATLYVATQLKLWGATPAGDDGTFFQTVPMGQRFLVSNESAIDFGGKFYEFGAGFKAASGAVKATGGLIYVGHGFVFREQGIDPYEGLDVKGKILVVASGLPKNTSSADMNGLGKNYLTPELAAKKYGAVGIITIPDQAYRSSWTAKAGLQMGGLQLVESLKDPNRISNIVAGQDLTTALFKGEPVGASEAELGVGAPERGFAFSAQKLIGLNIVERTTFSSARNVVAIVPGNDEGLRKEFVAYGAHIDHLGGVPGSTDRIFNGADDDGSGTVSILEIAHAYLTGVRPKRSSLFVWHVGEEKGLIGSAYFTNHPTVNLANVITQLNIDMIGRSRMPDDNKPANRLLTGPNEIFVVGSTKMSSDLQRVSETVNRSFLNLSFNYRYDDPRDPSRIFYRSDHYNYASKGIPIIFYFDGEHEDYHKVTDKVAKIDFEKMSRVAQTVYATGWALANADSRPVIDKT